MNLLKTFLILFIALNLASCCHCKKTQKNPAAKDVLKDRNTRDPRIDSLKQTSEKFVIPNDKN